MLLGGEKALFYNYSGNFRRFIFGFAQKNAIICLDFCKMLFNFAENQKL